MLARPPSSPPALIACQRRAAVDNERLHNQDRLRALVRDHGDEVRVHCAHCPFEHDRFALA